MAHIITPTFLCNLSTTGGTLDIGWSAASVIKSTNVESIIKHYYANGDVNWISIGY